MHWILKKDYQNEETDAMLEGELFGSDVSLPFEIGEEFTPPRRKFKLSRKLELKFVTDDDSTFGRMTDNLLIYEIPGLVISERFEKFLDQHRIDNVQYFDLDIEIPQQDEEYNHYVVANILDVVDCVDREQSDIVVDDDDPSIIDEVDKLVLDESRIPRDVKLFRLAGLLNLVIVSDDLKKAIESHGLTGCVFMPLEEFIL